MAPRTKSTEKGAATLACARAIAAPAAEPPVARVLAAAAAHAMKTEPARLPAKESVQLRARLLRHTFLSKKPVNMTKMLPVKSSAPVRITMARPAGSPIAPLATAARPGLAEASAGFCMPTHVISSPPIPIKAPARKESTRVWKGLWEALFTDALAALWNTPGGGTAKGVGAFGAVGFEAGGGDPLLDSRIVARSA